MRLLIALSLAAAATAAGQPIRALILTGSSDPAHDWRKTTPAIVKALANTGRFETRVVSDCASLTAADLGASDVLLLNYNGPRWGAAAERAVEDFVAGGKGLVSFHGVTYGEFYGQRMLDGKWIAGGAPWEAYPKLIGATWDLAKIGHGKRHAFQVRFVDRDHPVAKGLDSSFTADDELYHRLTLLPETRVLAAAFSAPDTGGTGNEEPIVWTAPFGRGRTLHITLGHDARALELPSVAAVIARATEWAASGRVR